MNHRTISRRAVAVVWIFGCLSILTLMTAAAPQQTPANMAIVPVLVPPAPPNVIGPVRNTTLLKDPTHGYPFNATPMDLKKTGYVEEEFFIEGKANRFVTSATANA